MPYVGKYCALKHREVLVLADIFNTSGLVSTTFFIVITDDPVKPSVTLIGFIFRAKYFSAAADFMRKYGFYGVERECFPAPTDFALLPISRSSDFVN